jgi:hypothetical protein
MQSFSSIRHEGGSLEKKLRSFNRTQKQNKYSRKVKQSLVELRDIPANQISNLQYRVYDIV